MQKQQKNKKHLKKVQKTYIMKSQEKYISIN